MITCLYFYLQGNALCKECFFHAFEEEIHHTIVNADLFKRNETIAIGASGGKGTGLKSHCFCIGWLQNMMLSGIIQS